MAILLTPKPADLGIMAPLLGPWFSDGSLELPLATDTLSVAPAFAGTTDWLAPASGVLSLYITSSQKPPAALCSLQDADGRWPFPDQRLLAYFRLLPEVESRLHALMGLLPAATAQPIGTTLPTAVGTPARPQLRSLAVLLPQSTALTADAVLLLAGGRNAVPGENDTEKLLALGLEPKGATLVNAQVAMTRLRRPGGKPADRDRLLTRLPTGAELWSFDRRGRAIDPGAVACWWSWLLATAVGADPAGNSAPLQMIAPDIPAADYPQSGGSAAVALFAAGRCAHLVDAHEGPLGEPLLGKRLQDAAGLVTGRLLRASGTAAIELSISALGAPTTPPTIDNPQVDDAPRARIAVLPAGTYGAAVTLWPGGMLHAGLARDFVRVGVVDEEIQLVGVARRDARAAVNTPLERLQSSQNRPSTRIGAARTGDTAPVLLANSVAVADQALAVPNATAPTRWVMGTADARSGGTPDGAMPARSPGPLPEALIPVAEATEPQVGQYRVRGLQGGGLPTDRQLVLLEINLGSESARAWARAWPRGIDLDAGFRTTLTGGAARADDSGLLRAVLLLPNGRPATAGSSETLGMDVLLLLPDGAGGIQARRLYGDCRFARPAARPGAPVVGISGDWWICETGASGRGSPPRAAVPPGGRVIVMGDPPALVDVATIAPAVWQTGVLQNRLRATDLFTLSVPAFQSCVDRLDAVGRPLARADATVADATGGLAGLMAGRLQRVPRDLASNVTASSQPHVLQDRLEMVVARVDTAAANAMAVLGSVPLASWMPGSDRAFHLGQPGVPASIETHGTGAALSGPPALALAEYARERTAGLSFAEVQSLPEPLRSAVVQSEIAVAAEAGTPWPAVAEGSGAGPVVAVLRTCKADFEGIPGVCRLATQTAWLWPFSQNEAELEAWLDTQVAVAGSAGTRLRQAAGGRIDSVTRALDRRIQVGAFGASETLDCLRAAVARAQDLIYIETPALDMLLSTEPQSPQSLWAALIERMRVQPGLHLVLCVSALLAARAPARLQAVRDHCLLDALQVAAAAALDRFAVFSPAAGPGRSLRIASTSVIVDDALALTGTTHLSRRGLTWDSSVAVSVFDERLVDGRPQEVQAFRRKLMADRLGIAVGAVPLDADACVAAIRSFAVDGSERLSSHVIQRPAQEPTGIDLDVWHPDGHRTDLGLPEIVALFAAAAAITDLQHAIPDY